MPEQQYIEPSAKPLNGKEQAARADLTERLRDAVIGIADFDTGGIAGEITEIVETAVRRRFQMTTAQFDLAFSDMEREVDALIINRLGDAIDLEIAVAVIADEILV